MFCIWKCNSCASERIAHASGPWCVTFMIKHPWQAVFSSIQCLVTRITHKSAEDARSPISLSLFLSLYLGSVEGSVVTTSDFIQIDELVTCSLICRVLILVAKWQRNFQGSGLWTTTKCMGICMTEPSRFVNYTCLYIRQAKAYRKSKGTAPLNLNLGTMSRWMINCTFRPLYKCRKHASYPLRGFQCWSGRFGKDRNLLALPRTEPRTAQSYPSHCTDWAVGNDVNKTVVFTNQDSSEVFRHTSLELCRSCDEVVLFVLAVSRGGRLKKKVHMESLGSRRWNGRG
jgi:hypothetical protein